MTSKAKTFDQYYTPDKLAERVIEAFTIVNPKHIADFAVGDGRLLWTAQKKWPSIRCTAIDIDEDAIITLQGCYPKWKAFICDFTNTEARKPILTIRNRTLRLAAIALNPPFSIQRGKVRYRKVNIAGTTVRCSPSLAFVVDALAYLSPGGQLVAIIPQGPLYNDLDVEARQLLKRHYGFEIVELIPQAGFKDCEPRTAIVRFTEGVSIKPEFIALEAPVNDILAPCNLQARVVRGSISNSRVESSDHPLSFPFIHTTDLATGKLDVTKKRIFKSDVEFATGPAVLIPRVCKPDVNKVVILPVGITAVLSDCVIAVECLTLSDAEKLRNYLVSNWSLTEQIYVGTCARYVSVSGFSTFLVSIGCELLACLKGLRRSIKTQEVLVEVEAIG
ncbi:hypothetical protein [Hymenobacter sp. UYP22]|uniref:hypothetical protein n=1 Tax=Hymenobacter sp. UYP22 TaxID=3156348 RepID=UPI003398AA01